MTRMQPKIQEYLSAGVEWIWLIDPQEKQALCYSRENPGGTLCDVLRAESPAIAIPLEQLFNPQS